MTSRLLPYACLVAGVVAALVYTAVSAGARDGVFLAAGAAASGAIVLGLRVHRPSRRVAWLLLALMPLSLGAGEVVWGSYLRSDRIKLPLPSGADPLFLAGHAAFAAGIVFFVARYGADRRKSPFLDAAIVTFALSSLAWGPLTEAVARERGASAAGRIVLALYPSFALLVLALLPRLFFTSIVRTEAPVGIALAAVALLAGDAVHTGVGDTGSARTATDLLWLGSFALLATTALHPSMATLGAVTRPDRRLTGLRFALLILPALAVPFLLIGEAASKEQVGLAELILGTALVPLLVIRMRSIVGAIEKSRHFEAEAKARADVTFDVAASPMALVDPAGHVLGANPALCRLTGHGQEDFARKPLDVFVHAQADALERAIAAAVAEQAVQHVACRIAGPRGVELPMELDFFPIANGEVSSLLVQAGPVQEQSIVQSRSEQPGIAS